MIKLDFSNQIGKKILIQEKSKSICINVEDIICIISNDYICTIYLVNEENGLSAVCSLNEFEKELEEYGGFLRVNRSTLINVKYFSGTRTVKGKKYIKINDTEVVMSKGKNVLLKSVAKDK